MTGRVHISRAAGLLRVGCFLLYVLGAMVVAAALTVLMVDLLQGSAGGTAAWLLEKGPSKIFRRILLILIVPAVFVLIRSLGWQGLRDSGWRADGAAGIDPAWRRDLGLGVLLGLATIGCLVGVSLLAGARAVDPAHRFLGELGVVAGYAAAALVVGLFEETLARGILFRVASRLWGAWPAALGISVLFAYAHYLKPDGSAFEHGSWLDRTLAVTTSALTGCTRVDDVLWRLVNTALMSIFLCFLVQRTGTVWLAAGAHTAWVWVMKLNGRFSDIVYDPPPPAWAPTRPAAIDSPVTAMILVLMVACVCAFRPRPDSTSTPGRGPEAG